MSTLITPNPAAAVPPATFRPVLVPIFAVMQARHLSAEAVTDMVDTGELRWVFDVAVERGSRELRFWLSEILEPAKARLPDEASVIARIVGHEFCYDLRGGTVKNTLYVSRMTVLRLVRAGELHGEVRAHALWVTRDSLVNFLIRRLVA